MTKHRSPTAKKQTHASHAPHTAHKAATHHQFKEQPRIMPLHSPQEVAADARENLSPFMAWPSHMFEMMMMPWRGTPVEAWMQSWRIGDKPELKSPTTDSK